MAVAASLATHLTSTAEASSYTFNAAALGDEADDRYIYLLLATNSGATDLFTSVTVGGLPAQICQQINSGTSRTVGIAGLYYPTGTTADIVVAIATGIRMSVGVINVTGHAGLRTNAATDITVSADALSATIPVALTQPVLADSALLVIASFAFSITGTVAWTGATEAYDATLEVATHVNSGAIATGLSAGAGVAVTAQASATVTSGALVGLCLAPGTITGGAAGGGGSVFGSAGGVIL